LNRNPAGPVDTAEIGDLPAVAGETGVKRPVDVIADQRKVPGLSCATGYRRSVTGADDNDPAVGLDSHGAPVIRTAEVGRLLAVTTKRGIERSVSLVTGDREIAVPASCDHDPAVGLNRHPTAALATTEICTH
jgi:hypothetical protein